MWLNNNMNSTISNIFLINLEESANLAKDEKDHIQHSCTFIITKF